MAGSWSNTYQSSLTIPTGATTGARIVIDGVTGLISVYNSSNLLVDTIGGSFGDIISYATGLTLDVALSEGSIEFGTSSSGFTGAGSLTGDLLSGGGLLLSTGTGDATHDDALELVFRAGDTGQTTGSSTAPKVIVGDAALSSAADVWVTGSVIAADVATQSAETWHAPSFGANWANGPSGGTVQLVQYRRDCQDNLVIVGTCHTTSAAPAATLFTLPAGYRPTIEQRLPTVINTAGTITIRLMQILSSGAVQVFPALAAANVDVAFSVAVPLGHLP
jgi:hypothetical protein